MTTILKTTDIENPIPIKDITEVKLGGTGVLDKFLELHQIILDREFNKGRISGKEYSDTFTKTYIANLELSIRLVMEKEKQAYEVELIENQINKTASDILLANKQIELASKELELKTAMLPLEVQLITAQVAKMEADATLAEKQLLLADKELALKDRELTLLDKQVTLTEQKVLTEQAQTDPSVITEGSVIAMNNKVLQAQVDGFKRDAEQKAASTLLQTWLVRLNNDAALTNDANMLKDNYIGRAVETMMEGVGMDVSGRDETDDGSTTP